jgi:hypothetical protein
MGSAKARPSGCRVLRVMEPGGLSPLLATALLAKYHAAWLISLVFAKGTSRRARGTAAMSGAAAQRVRTD